VVAADTGLDVNIINASVSVDDGGSTISVDDGAGSLTVDGTVSATQGTSPWVIGDGGGSITVDGTVTVTATQLDIDNLNATDDAVQAWVFDGSGNDIDSRQINDLAVPHNISPPRALDTISYLYGEDSAGTTWDAITATANALDVSLHDSSGGNVEGHGFSTTSIVAGNTGIGVMAKVFSDDPDATTTRAVTSEEQQDNDEGADTDIGLHISDIVKRYHEELTDIETIYDDSPTSANSAVVDCRRFRHFSLHYSLTSANTPTSIKFQAQFAEASSPANWFNLDTDFFSRWEHEDTEVATEKLFCIEGPCAGKYMRIAVTATGTDASNTFTIDHAFLHLWN
jgi:hypothetical protein